jgi:hypothetical protein
VLLDRLLEPPARKQLQHLRENAAYFHWAESPVVELVLSRNPIQHIRGLSLTDGDTFRFGQQLAREFGQQWGKTDILDVGICAGYIEGIADVNIICPCRSFLHSRFLTPS